MIIITTIAEVGDLADSLLKRRPRVCAAGTLCAGIWLGIAFADGPLSATTAYWAQAIGALGAIWGAVFIYRAQVRARASELLMQRRQMAALAVIACGGAMDTAHSFARLSQPNLLIAMKMTGVPSFRLEGAKDLLAAVDYVALGFPTGALTISQVDRVCTTPIHAWCRQSLTWLLMKLPLRSFKNLYSAKHQRYAHLQMN